MLDLSIGQHREISNKGVQAHEPIADGGQISTGLPKKPVISVLVNQGTRESIVAQVCVFGKTCGQVARQMGIDRAAVETVLIQEMSKRCAEEYRRGYNDGRRPSPPASALRPQLRRAA